MFKEFKSVFLSLSFVLFFCPVQAFAGPVLVAAASSMKYPLDEMAAAFKKERPEIDVRISYASSGSLFGQIKNGAPFDLFLSADRFYPDELGKLKLNHGGEKPEIYALGRIVIWLPGRSGLSPSREKFETLLSNKVRKIAIANPRHAPYGRAAIQALKKYGIYEKVKEKLVFGENISQAAQFASTDAAQAGILSYSMALSPVMKKSGHLWNIPVDGYESIYHARIILKNGRNFTGAREFARYLSGSRAVMILEKFGFLNPDSGQER